MQKTEKLIITEKMMCLNLSVHYYMMARKSVFLGYYHLAGNLYHHAFEMLLKYILFRKYTSLELKDKFKHNLPLIWSEAKPLFIKPVPKKFDAVIKELQHWEEIRYPQYKNKTPFVISASVYKVVKRKPKTSGLEDIDITDLIKDEFHYKINIDDFDELYKKIVLSSSIKTWIIKFFIGSEHKEARRLYQIKNKHMFRSLKRQ